MMKFIWLWCGGGLGTVCRYLFASQMTQWYGSEFPLNTLSVNLLGCLFMGCLLEGFSHTPINPDIRLALTTGVLGGFTTFSAFGVDIVQLIKTGHAVDAVSYVLASVLGGVMAVLLGIWLTKSMIQVWFTP